MVETYPGTDLQHPWRDGYADIENAALRHRNGTSAEIPAERAAPAFRSSVARLGLPAERRRSLACTNIIENLMGAVRRVCRNVKCWRSPSTALRWTGSAMQEAAKGFRRRKAHQQLPLLNDALAKHKAKAVPSNEHLAHTAKAA